jgi:hypothetical protein
VENYAIIVTKLTALTALQELTLAQEEIVFSVMILA